jgi:Fe-S-cluster containining protein
MIREHGAAVSARVEGAVAALLDGGSAPEALIRAAAHAHAVLDDEGARALARSVVGQPACSAGCSYCCHVHVEATVPEILAVAVHLERTLEPGALAALRERLARHATHVDRLSDDERWAAKIPCALLADDGRCSIYAVRPLRCRAFHSCSVEACREAFAGDAAAEPQTIPALDRAHDAVEEGYDRALVAAGLSATGQRLEVGLAAALAR